LEKVIFIPCNIPPHKKPAILPSAEHRLAMLKLAIEDNPLFEISDMEIKRSGISYSIDTIKGLRRLLPNTQFFFIIGADSLMDLHLWKNIDELLNLCIFVPFARPGISISELQNTDLGLGEKWNRKLSENIVMGREIQISSSEIRHRVAEGMSIRYLVPDAVELYIMEHHLYER